MTARRSISRLVWLVILTLATALTAPLVLAAPPQSAGPPIAPALTLESLDLTATQLTVDEQPQPLDPLAVKELLALTTHKSGYQPPSQPKAKWQLDIVFKSPVAVGTAIVQAYDRDQLRVHILRPDYAAALTATAAEDWQPIKATQVFPVDFRTRAIRLAGRGAGPTPSRTRVLLYQPRLASITSLAVGSGEKAPFGSHPDAIPRGRTWVNTGSDPKPGAPKQILRGPISDALPSWYALSWDEPQTLAVVRITSNAEQVKLWSYRGDPRKNPALAPASDWIAIETRPIAEINGEISDRVLPLAGLETLAIKLEITASRDGAVAEIRRFDALVDIGAAAGATSNRATPNPFAIRYQQPFAGTLAMVITDEQGRHLRNLVALVDRTPGEQEEGWDLKDEYGRTVAPGKYRWKAIAAPPIGLEYQFAVAPNVEMFSPDRAPWQAGESGPHGWLADHAPPTTGATVGEHVYFGAPGVESGVSLIECDANGKKLWARHNFGPFSGPEKLAGDGRSLFILARGGLRRLDPATHTISDVGPLARSERGGKVVGLAAHQGEVYVSFQSLVPFFDNALAAGVVDLDHCLPRYPERIPDVLGNRRVQPNPRQEFLRLLRLTGTPAGQDEPPRDKREGHFPIDLETEGDAKQQFILVAFKQPVPLGSIVFPCPGKEYRVELSALKANAPYPPNPRDEASWQAFPAQPTPGWTCVAAPPGMRTRAVRVKVMRGGTQDDPLDTLLDSADAPDLDSVLDGGTTKPKRGPAVADWFVRIAGMKILRRRFASLTATSTVRVSRGRIDPSGVWDAERVDPLSPENPGTYLIEWPQAQAVAGLAIQEIDGATTEVDVWEGPASGEIPLAGEEHWRHVATYTQARRDSYQPAFDRNDCARYIDGYVDFGSEITTRAVRLRVVQQWSDNGQRGTASGKRDREGKSLDPRRCKIYGVAALRYLGEEPALDHIAYQRLEVLDGATGKLKRELPSTISFLATGPRGELYGLERGRVFAIDPTTGATTSILPDFDGESRRALRMTVGPDGRIYVYTTPERVIRVYGASGEFAHTIGEPGGAVPGPWNPKRFLTVSALVADAAGSLWVVESQDVPRRIIHYRTDGTLVKEHFGNTHYGGGGILDRYRKQRLLHDHVLFEIDWKTGAIRIAALLAERMPSDCVPIQLAGKTYFCTAPLSYNSTQQSASVYVFDEPTLTARLAAAFGEANHFAPLKGAAHLARLAPGKVPSDYTFLWSDQNGNGQVDADEVTWELKADSQVRVQLGGLNRALRCRAGDILYAPTKFLADGTPIFAKQAAPARGIYELSQGRVFEQQAKGPLPNVRFGTENENVIRDAKGERLWGYPTDYSGVSGLYLPSWEAGYVTNEFGVIGHETTQQGDLGEFLVVHGNNGQWKVWTADGMLAAVILRHKFDPAAVTLSTLPSERGTRHDGLTAGQEHFHGYFTKTEEDGRYYIVHGHNFIGLWEVLGLEGCRRMEGELTVTVDDVQRVRAWEEELARREVKSQARQIECVLVKSDALPEVAAVEEDIKLFLGYDEQNLYLRWTVNDQGALANSGTDFQRYFKTGAAVEFSLGADPAADPARTRPALGDVRILITEIAGKPTAVLYQPVAASAQPSEAWETSTPAGGVTRFDRVVRLAGARIQIRRPNPSSHNYSVDAAIPLSAIGLSIRPGASHKFDFGVLVSDDGHAVKRRLYWSNRLANGTTDEAVEARLEPHLWGTLTFAAQSAEEKRLTEAVPDVRGTKPKSAGVDDLLDDLERKQK